jgi:hypothetical protein
MKLISVTILLICITAATFSKWILIASFELNKKYVARELCINKNNPASHCHGSCFLNNQLNNEEKSNGPVNTGKEKFEIQLFFVDKPENRAPIVSLKPAPHSAFQDLIAQEVVRRPFHPPSRV